MTTYDEIVSKAKSQVIAAMSRSELFRDADGAPDRAIQFNRISEHLDTTLAMLDELSKLQTGDPAPPAAIASLATARALLTDVIDGTATDPSANADTADDHIVDAIRVLRFPPDGNAVSFPEPPAGPFLTIERPDGSTVTLAGASDDLIKYIVLGGGR